MPTVSPQILSILMLFASNVFMTFAWYGHLKYKDHSLPLVIMASWGIAFFEYWLAVPANRWGSAVYTAAQLKTIQEVITLTVFAAFSVLYLKEPLGWNHALGFASIAFGAFLIFHLIANQGRATCPMTGSAKQSRANKKRLDCFVALLLAMTAEG